MRKWLLLAIPVKAAFAYWLWPQRKKTRAGATSPLAVTEEHVKEYARKSGLEPEQARVLLERAVKLYREEGHSK